MNSANRRLVTWLSLKAGTAVRSSDWLEEIMITPETASAIWCAYREIAASEKLLADMADARENPFGEKDKYAPTLNDAFGRKRQLQMGIPSGENCHRIFDVNPELAESVIRAHIAKKTVELVEANERARIELNSSNK